MENALLYVVTTLIWGSTWLAIKFQLGQVAPEASIAYRFLLAAGLLLAFSRLRRLSLDFNWREHAFIALQGLLLFSLNYILVYVAELYLTSGLVALVFSTIIVLNVFFAALFLGDPIRPRVLLGAGFGLLGLALVFWLELAAFDLRGGPALGLALCLASAISASLGNITAARNQRHGLPIVQTNALGMGYGALFMLLLVVARGTPLSFDPSIPYVLSLAYLALFGSVVGFGTYLTLLGRIGPDRAAYVSILFPIIALVLSTLFEGLTWTPLGLSGVGLVVIGNVIVLLRRRPRRTQVFAAK